MNKLWLAIAGAFATLWALLMRSNKQRDKAQQETRNERAKVERAKDAAEIHEARQQANEEARNVQAENYAKRGKRPTGNFGDRRLRNDD